MNYKIKVADAILPLMDRVPFMAGAMVANWEINDLGEPRYIVRSYGVIIAEFWQTVYGEKFNAITDEKFSVTTSKHTNLVRKAWELA